MHGASMRKVASKLRQAGWRTRIAPAIATGRSDSGTHGGIIYGQRAHLAGFAPPLLHAREAPPDQWAARIIRAKGADILFIVAYMDDSVGFAGNIARFGQIRDIIRGAGMPFVLVADFNMEPQELVDSKWLCSVGGLVITPPVTSTCSVGGRLIDFVVIHNSLSGSVKVDIDHTAPWKPHLGLDIRLSMRPRQVHVLKQVVPVALPTPLGPPAEVTWSQAGQEAQKFMPQVRARLRKPAVPDALRPRIEDSLDVSLAVAAFVTKAEVFHTLVADIPGQQRARHIGRGATPQFKWAPALRTQEHALARYNWPGSRIWAIIGHRMDMIAKLRDRKRGRGQIVCLLKRLGVVSAEQVRQASAVSLDEVLKLQWAVAASLLSRIDELSDTAWRDLRISAEVWLEQAEQQRRSANNRDFTNWVKQALENHSKVAHRFAKGNKAPAPEEDEILRSNCTTHTTCPDEAMRERVQQWSGYWIKGESRASELAQALEELGAFRRAHPDHDREAMTADDWRSALRRLSADRAKGQDQLQPRDLRNLPQDAFLELEHIGVQMDQHKLPWQSVENTVAIQGKPAGGDRPITIVTLLHAARSKHRGRWTREWHAREDEFWGTAVRGSSALRSGLIRRLLDETCVTLGASTVSVYYDIRKFYDSVNLARLIRWGLELGWNSDDLQFYIAGHLCPRRLKVGAHHSDVILVDGSLMAGCVAANSCAKTVLFALLRDIHAQLPASIQQFVDDLAQRVEGTADHVVRVTVEATKAVVSGLAAEGFSVAANKCGILGPNHKLCVKAQRKLSRAGIDIPVVRAIRDLGLDAGGGKRRSVVVLRGRAAAARGRITRIRLLSRRIRRAGKLFLTNARPAAVWGSSASGMSRRMLASLRTDAARATGVVKVAGACVTTTIAMTLGSSNDPAVTVPTSVIHDWIDTWKKRPDLHQRIRQAWTIARDASSPTSTWHRVCGPMGAAIKTVRDLRCDPCEPNRWQREDGTYWHFGSDAAGPCNTGNLLDEVRAQLEEQAWCKASEHYNGKGCEGGIDPTMLFAKLRALRRAKSFKLAGLLQHVAAGATWPRARRAECKLPIDDTICPRCGLAVEDEFHRAWACPANGCEHEEHGQAFRSSERLGHRAAADRDSCPVFWLRGLVPKAWTALPPPPPQLPVLLTGGSCWSSGTFHTDGAGGKWGSDPRRRRCGWGAVRLVEDAGTFRRDVGAYGGLPGAKQTVPLAELHAAMQVVRLAVGAVHAGGCALGLVIRVDAAYVEKGFRKSRTGAHSYNHDQWQEFWHWHDLYPGNIQVIRIWRSHATADEVAAGCIPPFDLFGNYVADSLADEGAKLVQVSSVQAKRITDVDRDAADVLNRLLAAAACAAEADRPPPAGWRRVPRSGGRKRIPIQERVRKLEAQGHRLEIAGTLKQRFFRCRRCLRTHGIQHFAKWEAEGPCYDARPRTLQLREAANGLAGGPNVRRRISSKRAPTGPWLGAPGGLVLVPLSDRPEPLQLLHGAHRSHRINFFRGITWCRRCGAWAVKQLRLLEHACAGPPLRKERRNRLNKGLTPMPGMAWPCS